MKMVNAIVAFTIANIAVLGEYHGESKREEMI